MRHLILAVVCASQLAAQGSDTAGADRARAVVMRHMEAIGGLEAYRAAQSGHMLIAMRIPGLDEDARLESWYVRPNLVYVKGRSQYGMMEGGFDGKIGWTITPDEGPRLMTRPPDNSGAVFDPWTALERHSVSYVGEREKNGRKMDALQLTDFDGKINTLYFDAETGLLSRLDVGDPSAPIPVSSVRIEQYKRFETLLYATRLTTKRADGGELATRVLKVDHKPVDPRRFELPRAVADLAAKRQR